MNKKHDTLRLRVTCLIVLVVLFLVSNIILAQSEPGGAFLLIAPGARAGGMGETQVAVANDAYATYWNPAGLAIPEGREIAVMHMNWLPGLANDVYYEFLAYRHQLGNFGAIGFHGTYVSLGEIVHTTTSNPEPLGTFSSYMWSAGISYAQKLTASLSIGMTVKYYQQFLAPARVLESISSDAVSGNVAFDIGILQQHLLWNRMSFGVTISNIGGPISFLDKDRSDPAPTRLRTGVNFHLIQDHNLSFTIAYDASKILASRDASDQSLPVFQAMVEGWSNNTGKNPWNELLHNIGGELWIYNTLAIRAGGIYQKTGELYTSPGTPIPTMGAGLRIGGVGLDFGYILGNKNHPLANTMRFSANMEF